MRGGSVELGDPPQRAEGGAGASPLTVPPVLSGAQEVLAPPVIGVFVQHPVALHDVDGGDVTGVEALVQVWAVVHELQILAPEIGLLKDLHSVVSIILWEEMIKCRDDSAVCPTFHDATQAEQLRAIRHDFIPKVSLPSISHCPHLLSPFIFSFFLLTRFFF